MRFPGTEQCVGDEEGAFIMRSSHTPALDEDHRLWPEYCEDYNDHIGDWQNDTPEYRHAHMPRFPSFDEWLVKRVVADVENAIWDASHPS